MEMNKDPFKIPELVEAIASYLDWKTYGSFRGTNSFINAILSKPSHPISKKKDLFQWKFYRCHSVQLDFVARFLGTTSLLYKFNFPNLQGYPTFYTSRLEIFLGWHCLQMTAIVPLLIGLYNNLPNYPISTIVVYNNYRDVEVLFDLILPPYEPFMLNGVSMNSDADVVEAFKQKNVELIVGLMADVSHFQPMFSYFSIYKPHGP